MKKLMFCGIALILAAPLASQAATNSARPLSPAIRVRTNDLDLSNKHDAAVLLKRLNSAATEACGGWISSNPNDTAAARDSDCHKDAVNRAVAQINAPSLNALYGTPPALAEQGF